MKILDVIGRDELTVESGKARGFFPNRGKPKSWSSRDGSKVSCSGITPGLALVPGLIGRRRSPSLPYPKLPCDYSELRY